MIFEFDQGLRLSELLFPSCWHREVVKHSLTRNAAGANHGLGQPKRISMPELNPCPLPEFWQGPLGLLQPPLVMRPWYLGIGLLRLCQCR